MSRIVRFVLLKRKPGTTRTFFSEHWSTIHLDVLLKAGLQDYNLTYCQNHFAPLEMAEEPLFDGCPQMLQPDQSVLEAGFQQDTRYLTSVRADEELFLDMGRGITLFGIESRIRVRERTNWKVMAFASFEGPDRGQSRPDTTLDWGARISESPVNASIASINCYDVFKSRGLQPDQRFDAVLECDIPDPHDALAVAALIRSTAPRELAIDDAFVTLARSRRFF